MTPQKRTPFRLLLAVAIAATLVLSGCGDRPVFSANGTGSSSGNYFGWGSGWGGNRDWGGLGAVGAR